MNKRVFAMISIAAFTTFGFVISASADQCPTTATCGSTIPVIQNPLATTTSTTSTPLTGSPTATSTTSNASTSPTTIVATVPVLTPVAITPTVPLNTAILPTATIAVPTLQAPAAVTTSSTTTEKIPVLPVPSISWGTNANGNGTNGSTATVTPNYPSVGGNSSVSSSKGSGNVPVVAATQAASPETAAPQAATPEFPTGDTNSLPWGTILFVTLGGLIGMAGRTAWDRAGSKIAASRS